MKKLSLFLAVSLLTASLWAQLQSGPMVGYVEMREAMLWAQTQTAAIVYVS